MSNGKVGAAFFSLFAVVACNAILGNESSHELVPKSSCLLGSDCPGEQICIFAICSNPCKGDKDCQRGDRCLVTGASEAACVAPTQAACADATCPSGTNCIEGTCRTACDESTPCRVDQVCKHAACVGIDSDHDPDAVGLGGAGESSGAGGTLGGGGSHDPSEGGDAGGEPGGSGGTSVAGRGGQPSVGGMSNGGSAGKAGGGTSGSGANGGAGGTSGAGATSGSGGAGGTGGTSGAGATSGSSGSGGASCVNGTYRCLANPPTSQQCVSNAWSTNQLCATPTPACFAGKCLECADPAKDCASNVPRSCVNGSWTNGSACTGGTTCSAGACTCTLTTCGSSCTNTQTDAANCGTCSHSCQGGACTAGKCQPVSVATGQSKPWSIATDGATLFWVNLGNNTVVRYALPSGTATALPATGNCAFATGGLAVGGGKVWWTENEGTCWANTPGTGTATEVYAMWGRNATMLMGVSALSNGTAYMIDPGDFFLVRSSGGAYSYQKATTGLAADDAGVYWLEGGNLVKQFPIASFGSGTPGILSSGITTAEGIVAYGSFVYFTTVDTVYRVPNTPGTAATPLVTGQVNVGGIAADASGVYWTNRAGGSAGLGSVMRAPLTGGSAVPLASGQNDPHGIALDATTVYWTNSAGGQVMKVAK